MPLYIDNLDYVLTNVFGTISVPDNSIKIFKQTLQLIILINFEMSLKENVFYSLFVSLTIAMLSNDINYCIRIYCKCLHYSVKHLSYNNSNNYHKYVYTGFVLLQHINLFFPAITDGHYTCS